MPSSSDGPKRSHRDDTTPKKRGDYSKPQLERLGSIRDLTRMPGGSINAEGSSGKPHNR